LNYRNTKVELTTGYQLTVLLFSIIVGLVSLWSIVVIMRLALFNLKPLWIIGCLFGFVGVGIDWTTPDDIALLFGITIPVVMVFKVMTTGHVIVKTGFPFVSVVALAMAMHIQEAGR
jgi:hypothetical protein